jgi:hypothetical protein
MLNEQIMIKVSKEDKATLQLEANQKRLKLSSYVRTKLFSK